MENLRGFRYEFFMRTKTIRITDLRFETKAVIPYDYAFSVEHCVLHFLESKGIKIDFKVTDFNVLLTRDFETLIK